MDNQNRFDRCKHAPRWDCEMGECGKCEWYEPMVESDEKCVASELTRKERITLTEKISIFVACKKWQEVEKTARRLRFIEESLAGTQYDY